MSETYVQGGNSFQFDKLPAVQDLQWQFDKNTLSIARSNKKSWVISNSTVHKCKLFDVIQR